MFESGSVHISLCVPDLAASRRFYEEALGAQLLVAKEDTAQYRLDACHLVLREMAGYRARTVEVDDEGWSVPVPHFGFILSRERWEAARRRLIDDGVITLGPVRRRAGTPAYHEVFFAEDPARHAIEIKTYDWPQNHVRS